VKAERNKQARSTVH